jgi:pilus assembly protein CpaB
VSSTTTDKTGAQTTEELPKTLFTVAVDQAEAERLLFASTHGELTFALLNDKSALKSGPGVSSTNLFG